MGDSIPHAGPERNWQVRQYNCRTSIDLWQGSRPLGKSRGIGFSDIAAQYNTRLEIVPERFVARLAAMQPQMLMAANDFERAPVQVELDVPLRTG